MKRWSIRLLLAVFCWLVTVVHSPAPLIYQPGEGWSYEALGGEGKWQRTRAKDQLEVARTALEKKDFSTALKAARRTVRIWPLSDYAPEAQYIVARCYEEKGNDERAFKEYQKVVERYPRISLFQEVLQRQFNIANKYLAGKWFRIFGYIPAYPSMEKTVGMFTKIVQTGPYSSVAPAAQLKIGAAREKQKNYPEAVRAYERAADRYNDRPAIAADATFKAGMAYYKEAKTAEYDQSAAASAIATFTDFVTLHPQDQRVKEAQNLMEELRAEQARGSFEIARFYEKKRKIRGALIYYNEVLLLDPTSKYANDSRKRIDQLKARLGADTK
ncbi:MAG TPA: outer membrane protein assembly factor BamD [Verrucomicrobiae bacterium]|nr:outer membrane protein assembly factor BamD [Verrucomicrobiae bacterium]